MKHSITNTMKCESSNPLFNEIIKFDISVLSKLLQKLT